MSQIVAAIDASELPVGNNGGRDCKHRTDLPSCGYDTRVICYGNYLLHRCNLSNILIYLRGSGKIFCTSHSLGSPVCCACIIILVIHAHFFFSYYL